MWVFLRFGFSDSVMEKLLSTIHTGLLPQLFRGTETLLGKRGRPDGPLGVLLRKKSRVARGKTLRGNGSSSLAN